MRKILIVFIIFSVVTLSCRLVSTVFTSPAANPTEIPLADPTSSPIPPTPTPEPAPPFAVLPGAPLFSPAFLHADLGCAWMGVAGQVFAADGQPLSGLMVRVTGNIADRVVDEIGITGAATGYGPGGYEIVLSGQAAPGVFWIQALDMEGSVLSEPFAFEMSGSCDQNLAVINFTQVGDY